MKCNTNVRHYYCNYCAFYNFSAVLKKFPLIFGYHKAGCHPKESVKKAKCFCYHRINRREKEREKPPLAYSCKELRSAN